MSLFYCHYKNKDAIVAISVKILFRRTKTHTIHGRARLLSTLPVFYSLAAAPAFAEAASATTEEENAGVV